MRLSILIALGMSAGACGGAEEEPAHQAEEHDPDRPQAEMRAAEGHEHAADMSDAAVEGIVRVVGSDPSPQVVLSVGEGMATAQIALVGEFRDELGTLSGVSVAVVGDSVANPQGMPAHAIDVLEYDVVSVNSAPAYLGVLTQRDGVWWLDREESFRLTLLPSDLEGRVGAKVWIAGPVDGDELRVQSYGIVREL